MNRLVPVPACETAFALAKIFKEEIAEKQIRLSLLFHETIKAAFGGADLHKKLEDAFAKHDIHVITDFTFKEVTEKAISAGGEQKIEYDLLMLVPPFRGQAMFGKEDFADASGFIETDDFLRVAGLEKVYAIGDITNFPAPKLAFMAIRQAQVAAENISSEIHGKIPRKIYNHDLAVVIDEAGANGIFFHYGIWDETLRGLKEGVMWSRMKKTHNYLWELARQG